MFNIENINSNTEDIHDVDFYLSPSKEQSFQDELRNLGTKARVPKVYACCEGGENNHRFLMMEALPAVSIADILEGKALLPEDFDLEAFQADLENFIDKMHKDRAIYHRDLHEGNIMIGKEKGEAFVIDFGAAVKFKGYFERGERGPYHLRKDGRDIILTSDEIMIQKVVRKLINHLTSKK